MLGGTGLVACAAFLLPALSMAGRDPAYEDELALAWGLLGLATVALFLPLMVGGIAILTKRPWARLAIWAYSAPLALFVPVGTAISGLNLWVLLTTREASADGGMASFERVVAGIWRALALMLAALFILGVMLLGGWLLRDVIDPPRPQQMTPLPRMPPHLTEPPEFQLPEPPRAPG